MTTLRRLLVSATLVALAPICASFAIAQVPPPNQPPPDGYQPVPNYTGAHAGLQFRNAINDRFSGISAIAPKMARLSFIQLPLEQDGLLVYCADCQETIPCASGGSGAWAFGAQGQWHCRASEQNLAGDVNGVADSNQVTSTHLAVPLALGQGGTGSGSSSGARTNLGAAASGANSDITSLSGLQSVSGASGSIVGFQESNSGIVNPAANLNLACTGASAPFSFCTGNGTGAYAPIASDGSDQTASFNAACAAVPDGSTILLPPATGSSRYYYIAGTVNNCAGKSVHFVGQGWSAQSMNGNFGMPPNVTGSVIKCGNTSGPCFYYDPGSTAKAKHLTFRDLALVGPGSAASTGVIVGTSADYSNYARWSNVLIANFGVAIQLDNVEDSTFADLDLSADALGLVLGNATNQNVFHNLKCNGTTICRQDTSQNGTPPLITGESHGTSGTSGVVAFDATNAHIQPGTLSVTIGSTSYIDNGKGTFASGVSAPSQVSGEHTAPSSCSSGCPSNTTISPAPNGSAAAFTFIVSNAPVVPGSFSATWTQTSGSVQLAVYAYDDGKGNLIGQGLSGTNTIDYQSGLVTLSLATSAPGFAPPSYGGTGAVAGLAYSYWYGTWINYATGGVAIMPSPAGSSGQSVAAAYSYFAIAGSAVDTNEIYGGLVQNNPAGPAMDISCDNCIVSGMHFETAQTMPQFDGIRIENGNGNLIQGTRISVNGLNAMHLTAAASRTLIESNRSISGTLLADSGATGTAFENNLPNLVDCAPSFAVWQSGVPISNLCGTGGSIWSAANFAASTPSLALGQALVLPHGNLATGACPLQFYDNTGSVRCAMSMNGTTLKVGGSGVGNFALNGSFALQLGSTTYSQLGTALFNNGQSILCTDCDPPADPPAACTSAGTKTGAIVTRINSTNICHY